VSTLHRAQLLLEPEQHEALAEIAEREGRSISDLVREIIRQHLAQRDMEARKRTSLQAIEELSLIRTKLREQHGLLRHDPLAEVRTEWENDLERLCPGEG